MASSSRQLNYKANYLGDIFAAYENLLNLNKKPDISILYIGCSNGDCMVHDLLPILPSSVNLFGVDKHPSSVTKARKKYFYCSPKIQFHCVNFEKNKPGWYTKHYCIISFGNLHSAKHPTQVFQNLYNALEEEGCVLLTYMIKSVVYRILEKLANSRKILRKCPDIKDTVISKYQNDSSPDVTITICLEAAGFVDIKCNVVDKKFVFDSYEAFKKTVCSFYKVSEPICMEILKELRLMGLVKEYVSSWEVEIPVQEIFIFAKKSITI